MRLFHYIALLATVPLAIAQFPPATNFTNLLTSPLDSSITITYQSPEEGTCTTVFPTQKQYTGYISIPPFALEPTSQNYSINTFFWFVEARENPETAPLTIYLNGGPGSSSMFGFFEETGPCEVVQLPDGSYGTQSRMFGWDRSSNVIFIDQPVQVGFSYDTLTNASLDLITGDFDYPPIKAPSSQPGYTFLNGTFGSGAAYATANTTEIAAQAVWHFLQSWLAAFPKYNPGTRPNSTDTLSTGVNLFAESYGGKYGPVFAKFFETQNQLRSNGTLSATNTLAIELQSLGIINGLIDDLIQDSYYPFFAFNNTYGIQAISQTDELNSIQDYTSLCVPAITACRQAMSVTDPEGAGDVTSTNTLCEAAQYACNNVSVSYFSSGRNVYDIRVTNPSPYPGASYREYLNEASVQASIGAAVNYTESSALVQRSFISTGDTIRGVAITDLAYLLTLGVRVALIHGDADYLCNWQGGEAVSLALAALLPNFPSNDSSSIDTKSYATAFPSAGYADIVVNSSYVGGAVRQYGNLSFSRVYNAGHFVPYYQPETAFTLFTRIILGTDLSTGEVINLTNFSSSGPHNSTYSNSAPASQPSPTCWIRDMSDSCSDDDIASIRAGDGVVEAGVWYANAGDYAAPSSSVIAGVPGTPVPSHTATSAKSSVSSVAPTGVYTATSTPTTTKSGAVARLAVDDKFVLVFLLAALVGISWL